MQKGPPAPALLACPLRPAGCGPRAGIERSRKRRKADRQPRRGGRAALHLPRRPVPSGAARSGMPSPAFGSGLAVLDGSRTRPWARPGPGPPVSPGRQRKKPNRDWAGRLLTGWQCGKAERGLSREPRRAPAPRAFHTHGEGEPEPCERERSAGSGARSAPGSGGAAPSADRSGASLGRGTRCKQRGSTASRREARSSQTNIFPAHP